MKSDDMCCKITDVTCCIQLHCSFETIQVAITTLSLISLLLQSFSTCQWISLNTILSPTVANVNLEKVLILFLPTFQFAVLCEQLLWFSSHQLFTFQPSVDISFSSHIASTTCPPMQNHDFRIQIPILQYSNYYMYFFVALTNCINLLKISLTCIVYWTLQFRNLNLQKGKHSVSYQS